MAFLAIFWHAGTLESCDFTERPFTGNAASAGSHASHGRAWTPSKSWPKSVAGNVPTRKSTRSAVRSQRLARDEGLQIGPKQDAAVAKDPALVAQGGQLVGDDRFQAEGHRGDEIHVSAHAKSLEMTCAGSTPVSRWSRPWWR